MKTFYCTANKLTALLLSALVQLNTPVLCHCQCMSVNCGASTHTGVKHLQTAYNNAYHILHYIPWNEYAHPHQIIYFVIRNNLNTFVQQHAYSADIFVCSLKLFNDFCKSPFLPVYNASVWEWLNAVKLVKTGVFSQCLLIFNFVCILPNTYLMMCCV